jgi:hypothetical protein
MMNTTNQREMTLHINPVEIDNQITSWVGTIELDGEQIAERKGTTFEELLARIYEYCSDANSVLPRNWLQAHGGTPLS